VVSSSASKETYGEWYYLDGKKEGELEFTAPTAPGSYDVRLYYNWPDGGYEIQRQIQFSLGGTVTAETRVPPQKPTPAAPTQTSDCNSGKL
jgi:hypothetical protein